MALPVFFLEDIADKTGSLTLPGEASRHIVQVLRMKTGEQVELTDGRGNTVSAEIAEENKKNCIVKITAVRQQERPKRKISIAISLIKNSSRFEWFLEKATEIGVSDIIPLICERTEKQQFRFERMKNILVSAMLQSQQAWLPELKNPAAFETIIKEAGQSQKFIAHCAENQKVFLSDAINPITGSQIILIGPEGDFTKPEIEYAILNHFRPVSLGETRLRTETAGIVAAALLAVH
jgi:16S rRNA (uracil1498-N3)-methyltransferase